MFVYPYKMGSESAKLLAQGIGGKRIKHDNSTFKGNPDKVVINWGSSTLPEEVLKCRVINPPETTAIATNKLKFFNAIRRYNDSCWDGVIIPQFTDDIYQAHAWSNRGKIVVARLKLTGNSGEGIVLIEKNTPIEDIPRAPLYVMYIPKKQEYRVHVVNGVAVDIQRKARRRDVADEDVNWRIRNHDNGFIFARNDLDVPDGVVENAVKACNAIGLDFGAVDVVYSEQREQAYVLEINTSPGLAGTTLEGYVERFKNWGQAVAPVAEEAVQAAPQVRDMGAAAVRPAADWAINIDDLAR